MKKLFILLLMAVLTLTVVPSVQAVEGVPLDKEHFPDTGFRELLKRYDVEGDGFLAKRELILVKELIIEDDSIVDLAGIEYFTELTTFNAGLCYNIEKLDLSKNTKLTHLNCRGNKIKTLDLSRNTKLAYLDCYGNGMEKLNIRGCTELEKVFCGSNRLSTLDLSTNISLKALNCSFTDIKALDFSSCTALEYLRCSNSSLQYLDLSSNKNIKFLVAEQVTMTHVVLPEGAEFVKHYDVEYENLALEVPGPIIKSDSKMVFVDGNNCFDPTELLGDFDVDRILGCSGATVNPNGIIKFKKLGVTMQYYFKLNEEFYAEFAIFAPYRYGDVTGDGTMNTADAAAVLRHDVKLDILPYDLERKIDVNGDGEVNSFDAALILMYDVHLIP